MRRLPVPSVSAAARPPSPACGDYARFVASCCFSSGPDRPDSAPTSHLRAPVQHAGLTGMHAAMRSHLRARSAAPETWLPIHTIGAGPSAQQATGKSCVSPDRPARRSARCRAGSAARCCCRPARPSAFNCSTLVTGWPLTARITSPGWMPAFSAAPPACCTSRPCDSEALSFPPASAAAPRRPGGPASARAAVAVVVRRDLGIGHRADCHLDVLGRLVAPHGACSPWLPGARPATCDGNRSNPPPASRSRQ